MKHSRIFTALLLLILIFVVVLYFLRSIGDSFVGDVHQQKQNNLGALQALEEPVQDKSVEELKRIAKSMYRIILEAPISHHCKSVVQTDKSDGWFFCNDSGVAPQKKCLIFSFGINYNYRFDNYWAKAGCEVFSFDPSQAQEGEHDPRIKFYFTGIGGEDTDTFVPRLNYVVKKKTEWKVRTMKTLLRELNHSNSVIDILKMDIEVSEWPVIRNLLDTGVLSRVKQLLVEWHIFFDAPPRETFPQMLQTLKDLEAMGFARFHKFKRYPISHEWHNINYQCDSGYINSKFLP